MKTYRVMMTMEVSTVVEVEADSPDEAMEDVYNSDKMPGSITYGAFGGADVDESGDWAPTEVMCDGKVVWSEESGK